MSFALPQFMQSPWNNLVWTAIDNETDTRTSLIIYNGAANTLPTDTGQYEVNCIMMHQAEKQLYSNIGTLDTPSWAPFGPGSQYPQPLVPGTFLFTDGATVYWSTALVGQVQYNASNLNQYGILNFNDLLVASNDVPNSRINVDLDVVNLASNTSFINSLLANNTFISGISTALLALSSFITNLITTLLANTTFISGITNIVNTSTSTSINLSTQITGTLGLGNGGTGASLSDPNYDAVWVWDDTTNTTRLANISGLTYNSGTNTLTASGTAGITSINGDTTAAQTISAGTGISVATVAGVTTITNTLPSSGGLFSVGISNKLGINITDADPSLAYIKTMKFGNDLVVLTRGTNNSGNFKVRVYSRNSDGGYTEAVIADIPTSNGIGTGVMSVSISKELDNSKLYVSKVSRSAGGGVQPVPMDIAIDEYDSSYSLVTTYTGQTLNSLFNSDVSSGFFVNGSSVYISLDNFRPGTVPKHWNRWTISGVSLTSVTDTNLVKGDDSPAFSDGTNAWFSEGGSVGHFTYSGISFTFIGTSNFPTSTIGVNLTTSTSTDSYQGVEIVSSGTKIGWFINTSRTMQEYSSTTKHMDYMYEYNVYDF